MHSLQLSLFCVAGLLQDLELSGRCWLVGVETWPTHLVLPDDPKKRGRVWFALIVELQRIVDPWKEFQSLKSKLELSILVCKAPVELNVIGKNEIALVVGLDGLAIRQIDRIGLFQTQLLQITVRQYIVRNCGALLVKFGLIRCCPPLV